MNEELFEYLYATEQVDKLFHLKEQPDNKSDKPKEMPYTKILEINNKNRG